MRVKVPAWQCEYPDCKHIWIKTSEDEPTQCARCRRKGWNTYLARVRSGEKVVIPPSHARPRQRKRGS